MLGPDVKIDVHQFDETLGRVPVGKIISMIESAGAGMVMLVGVQSNQFPSSLDIAERFCAKGIKVSIGGFHVSGTLAMLKERDPDVRRAEELGISLFAGEAEGRLHRVLRDAFKGQLKPVYDYLNDLPDLGGAVTPVLPLPIVKRAFGNTSFDAGRGCPFNCTFCTIINVQGQKSRSRTADDVESLVRTNLAQGVRSFTITDDNFARNKDWESIFDRLIQMREVEKLDIKFSIQIDTGTHKIPNFIEKARRAGTRRVFIGLENINPDNLIGARKNQNKITEYRKMLLEWKRAGALIYCGYIIGFPADTPESIERDIGIIQRELPVDILEFTCLTPLPGSVDHQRMTDAGTQMDRDLNRYDINHVTIDHPQMTRQEWETAFKLAWKQFYTDDHARTVLKRCVATGTSPGKTMTNLVWFRGNSEIEGVHPVEGGFFRLKYRKDRRPGYPVLSPFVFYPKYFVETLWKQVRWMSSFLHHYLILREVLRDPARKEYSDQAITPVADDEIETLEMFQTEAARRQVDRLREIEKHRHSAVV